jgi:uncharacterized membrane protein
MSLSNSWIGKVIGRVLGGQEPTHAVSNVLTGIIGSFGIIGHQVTPTSKKAKDEERKKARYRRGQEQTVGAGTDGISNVLGG